MKGRNIQTLAAPHVGRAMVLRMTLEYLETVADLLAGICTTITPAEVWKKLEDETYARRHLPQGSPSSPALANLCAYRMDCRLSGLAPEWPNRFCGVGEYK